MDHVNEGNDTKEQETFDGMAEVDIETIIEQSKELPKHSKEVVSYQRFGRIDKKNHTNPYKCHLCGFSCRFKESLLKHFDQIHPN